MRSVWQLVKHAEASRLAKLASGVTLNIKSCVLVPTASSWTLQLIYELRTWLQVNSTERPGFQIAPPAKHLGFFLGPATNVHAWADRC